MNENIWKIHILTYILGIHIYYNLPPSGISNLIFDVNEWVSLIHTTLSFPGKRSVVGVFTFILMTFCVFEISFQASVGSLCFDSIALLKMHLIKFFNNREMQLFNLIIN